MAIEDMFLMVRGVTGEAGDIDHEGEVEVVKWSWSMEAPASPVVGARTGKATVNELQVHKHVDQATPTLMRFLRNNTLIADAKLTIRKAGSTPLEYFMIEMEKVRITSLRTESEGPDLVERVCLGFEKVRVTYVPQDRTGAKGGGDNVFEADLFAG